MTRRALLSAAFAVWGLAIAISLASVWTAPAPAGQLPGLATRFDFDAHGPFRWMAGMVLLPILLPLLMRPVVRRLEEGAAWAVNATLIAPLVAIWFVTISRVPFWAIVPFGAVIAICTILRKRELAFTRFDVVLVPGLLALILSVNDAFPSLSIDRVFVVAALLLFVLRVAVALIPSPLPPALAFIAAPLGLLLQTNFFARDQRYFGWHAVAIAVITPFVLRFVLTNARRAIAVLVFVTYPLSFAAYINATGVQTAEGKPRIDAFEDSHPLLPASEYLAGERPYRDIIPTHGLIEDGLLDFAVMNVRGATLGAAWKTRTALGMLTAIALYALAWALTGSAEAAFLAVLLALMANLFTGAVRLLPALVALAFMCGAVRLRRVRWLLYAAIATVISGAMSIDFGAYTFLTLVVAVLRFPGDRMKALRAAAIGTAIAVIPLFGAFALFGILGAFFRTTFIELLSLGPVYTLTMFDPPAALPRNFPEAMIGVFSRESFPYLMWCVAIVFAGVMLARRSRRRFEPLVIVSVWMALTAFSYAERHHLYFGIVAAPFAVALTYLLLRRRHVLAPAISVALLILAGPTTHLAVTGWIREARGPVEQGWVEVPEIPRARGALLREHDVAALRSVQRYASLSLAPNETWLDFTNRGIFYFLLRRDCPIRQPEVAFYETEARQREVIARIESNPRVRAVLLPGPSTRYTVDGVTNQERAPLVWQYIQTHFAPDFEEGDVVMWRRK